MKNVLNYYYGLNPTDIHQNNKSYRCYVNSDEYLLLPYDRNINEIKDLYNLNTKLLQNNTPCHRIILNNSNQILTTINNSFYVLMKINIPNSITTLNDIYLFGNLYINNNEYKDLRRDNWYELWTKKIDYFEYQISQFGRKYPIIRSSVSYYIGMAETSICLLNNIKNYQNKKLVVSHPRIKKNCNTLELYNPLNLIVDSRARDLAEFYKEKFFEKKIEIKDITTNLKYYNLSAQECYLFFIRILFPSYYFDAYEQIIEGKINEKEILVYINKSNEYQKFLKEMYLYLRPICNLPEIEWIIKT